MLGIDFAKGLLTNEKAPYLVTLFVAALAWTIVRTTDRLGSVPFLEYRTETEAAATGIGGRFGLRLRNVSVGSRFECFEIRFVKRTDQQLEFGDAAEQGARIQGTVLALPKVTKAEPDEWVVSVTSMSPGADLTIYVPVKRLIANEFPAILASTCPGTPDTSDGLKATKDEHAPKSTASGLPILLKHSPTTFFVEYELPILWAALIGWLLLLLPSFQTARVPKLPYVPMEKHHDTEGSID